MRQQSNLIRIKRKTILYFVLVILILGIATPVLAAYLGPNRTVTETTSACKVILYECRYVPAKDEYRYKRVDSWSCASESDPWEDFPSGGSSQGCSAATEGDQYWEKEQTTQETTT
ncbi:MAG TPA: hypothetical protein VJM08_00490, partial [Anaerolineales bacterium]|nr:hypothetical protein [Anaerolineales bacterium]